MLCIVGVYLYHRKKTLFKLYLFFSLWFLLGIVMLLQIFPLDMTVADRWFYFPFIGLIGMLGVVLNTYASSPKRDEKVKRRTIFIEVLLIIVLSIITVIRNTNFHDEITLYTHDTQIQDNATLETNLGIDIANAKNMQAALPHLQKATERSDRSPQNLYRIGYLYETQGNLQKAQEYYSKALNRINTYYLDDELNDPLDEKIYLRLANVLLMLNDFENSEKISIKGLQDFPNSSILWLELAVSENKLHQWQQVPNAIQKTKNLLPRVPTDIIDSIAMTTMLKLDIPSPNISQITSYISSLIFN